MRLITTLLFVASTGIVGAGPEFNPADIVKKTLPSVVSIRGRAAGGVVNGSGLIVDGSGTIITNLHVIRGATSVAVNLANGDIYDQVSVRAFDERKDLAIIQVAAFGLPTIPLGDSETVQSGQRVVLVGSPLGVLEGSVSTGVVSGIRALEGYKVIQTDATANHGNSGGPMLDENGQVIGIVTFKVAEGAADNLNFAVPINYARGLLASASTMTLTDLAARLEQTSDPIASQDQFPATIPVGRNKPRFTSKYWTALGAAAASASLDAYTTARYVGHPGYCDHEAMAPWLYGTKPNDARVYAIITAELIGSATLSHYLEKKGRKWWSVPLMYTTAIHAKGAINNFANCR